MLDRLDEAFESAIHEDSSLLLIKANQPTTAIPVDPHAAATGAGDDGAIPAAVVTDEAGEETGEGKARVVFACLQFLGVVMRNCVNKHVFSSTEVRNLWLYSKQRAEHKHTSRTIMCSFVSLRLRVSIALVFGCVRLEHMCCTLDQFD